MESTVHSFLVIVLGLRVVNLGGWVYLGLGVVLVVVLRVVGLGVVLRVVGLGVVLYEIGA